MTSATSSPAAKPQAVRFTFGLWTVGNIGRDPFGAPTRPLLSPTDLVIGLGKIGAHGVNLHDNDLVPIDASASERDRIVREFKKTCADSNVRVPMASTNLFFDPAFKDGAFTSHSRDVRRYAVQKTMRGIDLAAELGAETYVFWGGREGTEVDFGKDPVEALKRMREAVDFLTSYARSRGHRLRFALEAKPNEPRGDIFLPTTGAMLAFIETLEHPEMVGVNPEVAHETMAGLNFSHAVAQALDAGKLFHIDMNDQKIGRFDQDLRFGSADPKGAFAVVKLLEDAAWDGCRHFDAHAYRSEDTEGVWDFARGCMRTYRLLQEKTLAFRADREIQGLLAEIREGDAGLAFGDGSAARALLAETFDLGRLAAKRLPYERLDQLVTELLMGVR